MSERGITDDHSKKPGAVEQSVERAGFLDLMEQFEMLLEDLPYDLMVNLKSDILFKGTVEYRGAVTTLYDMLLDRTRWCLGRYRNDEDVVYNTVVWGEIDKVFKYIPRKRKEGNMKTEADFRGYLRTIVISAVGEHFRSVEKERRAVEGFIDILGVGVDDDEEGDGEDDGSVNLGGAARERVIKDLALSKGQERIVRLLLAKMSLDEVRETVEKEEGHSIEDVAWRMRLKRLRDRLKQYLQTGRPYDGQDEPLGLTGTRGEF